MRFEPETLRCRSHPAVDLTTLVADVMTDDGPPVAFDPRRLFRRAPWPIEFEVVVRCPQGHEELVAGKAWRD